MFTSSILNLSAKETRRQAVVTSSVAEVGFACGQRINWPVPEEPQTLNHQD